MLKSSNKEKVVILSDPPAGGRTKPKDLLNIA
jgi:hypothetical protein